MQTNEKEQVARNIYECFNEHNLDKMTNFMSDQLQWFDMSTGLVMKGKSSYRQYDENWLKGFPDGKITIKNLLVAGECVIVEFVGKGTHTGTLNTQQGDIPPSGKTVELPFCDVLLIRDGKVIEGHSYYDRMSLIEQVKAERMRAAA